MKLDAISEIISQEAVKSVQDFGFILTVSGKNFAGQYFLSADLAVSTLFIYLLQQIFLRFFLVTK
ncbi:hypothetical protein SAMN05660826_00233 [Caldanaerovirga acetigignens]|uniref:Uncharacterized protein n=1 Tax=Caldanaerovirga acetigignens TaxID=447595 RepID=A0A1M7G1T5_9FIRM|nr:hypothetical protein SAMN05660826_00233 [Caldanaerovirga acetigignens]